MNLELVDDPESEGARETRTGSGRSGTEEAGLSAPLCQWCKGNPTKPAKDRHKPHVVLADGSIWRMYCGKSCAGQAVSARPQNRRALLANCEKLQHWKRRQYVERTKHRLATVTAPFVEEWGISQEALMRLILKVEHKCYERGYQAGYIRGRRLHGERRERTVEERAWRRTGSALG